MERKNPKSKTGNWMTKLSGRTQDLINTLGIPADMGLHLKDFVFEVAREQYKAGNYNGINWERKRSQANGRA